jgi:hypothetical protein
MGNRTSEEQRYAGVMKNRVCFNCEQTLSANQTYRIEYYKKHCLK